MNILKEMDRQTLLSKIMFNLERSQRAYSLYCVNKNYVQALRIFRDNIENYNLLISNCEVWLQSQPIIDYLFHLEDWFEQFKNLEKNMSPKLEDEFIFERINLILFKPNVITARLDLIIHKPSGIVGFVGLVFSNPIAVCN